MKLCQELVTTASGCDVSVAVSKLEVAVQRLRCLHALWALGHMTTGSSNGPVCGRAQVAESMHSLLPVCEDVELRAAPLPSSLASVRAARACLKELCDTAAEQSSASGSKRKHCTDEPTVRASTC
jgi:hypothetical protein